MIEQFYDFCILPRCLGLHLLYLRTMEAIDFSRLIKRNPSLAVRRIADEVMLVPIRSDARQAMGLYTLNPSAALLWDLADGEHCLNDCVELFCQRFEVESKVARQDLQILLTDLLAAGLVELL